MQLDPGGTLAAVLAELLPDAASPVSGDRQLPVAEFQQILTRLEAVIEERGVSQLPLDAQTSSQQPALESRSGEGIDGLPISLKGPASAWIDGLRSLAAQLKILTQSQHDPPTPGGEAEPAGVLAVVERVLEDVPLEETAGNTGTDATQIGITDLSDTEAGDSTPESWAMVVLEPVAFPEKDPVPPGIETVAPAAPIASVAVAPPTPSAMEGPMADTAKAGEGMAEFRSASAAAEQESVAREVTKQEVPASEEADESGPMPLGQEEARSHFKLPKDFNPLSSGSPLRASAPLTVTGPIDHPRWPDALGERLLWLQEKSVQTAELQIHPQHLGPVAVRIQVHEDQASVQFASHHAVVREALEAALPRLRELFANQQLQLTQVDVGLQFTSDQPGSQSGHSDGRQPVQQLFRNGTKGDAPAVLEDESRQRLPGAGNRLLNLYA